MLISVIALDMPCHEDVETPFVLRQDNGTDEMATRYQLYSTASAPEWTRIGDVLIYKLGQRAGERHQLCSDIEINDLSEDYFSLGANMQYYNRLIALYDRRGAELLTALRDIAFDDILRNQFRREVGLREAFGSCVNNGLLAEVSLACRRISRRARPAIALRVVA